MKVLLVRHAPAGDRQEFARNGKADSERPLTREGRAKMRRAAQGVMSLVPELDMIVSSPLTRAMQTARILAASYSDSDITRLDSLSPGGSHDATIHWLAKHSNLRTVALVGHEPGLSELFSNLVSGSDDTLTDFKKGGMALVTFQGKPAPGGATLNWLVTPAILRAIAGG
jgi:phosphohistidine phosphatase